MRNFLQLTSFALNPLKGVQPYQLLSQFCGLVALWQGYQCQPPKRRPTTCRPHATLLDYLTHPSPNHWQLILLHHSLPTVPLLLPCPLSFQIWPNPLSILQHTSLSDITYLQPLGEHQNKGCHCQRQKSHAAVSHLLQQYAAIQQRSLLSCFLIQ